MPVSDGPSSSASPPQAAAASWLARNATWLAAALIALHIGLAASSAMQKSATFDEGFHITAGAANWLGADFRLHSGNGILPQAWFALPIVLAPERFVVPNPDAIIENQPVRDFHLLTIYLARVFFYEVGNSHADILMYARSMALLLGAMLCALVFVWARRCFGPTAALLSCALCALSPNILAHARLATSDLIFALCLLLAIGEVWRSFWKPSATRIVLAGLALGLLALTKLSALGVIPMIGVLLVVRTAVDAPLLISGLRARSAGARAASLLGIVVAQGLVAVALIWLAYGLRFDAVPDAKPGRETMNAQWEWALERDSAVLGGIDALRQAKLLPEAYLFSAAFVWRQADERKSFFLGEVRSGGDARFFPTAIASKTPLALFGLLGIAGTLALTRRGVATGIPPDESWQRGFLGCTPFFVAAGVHGAFLVTSEINLGLRHALPIYPVLFIAAGAALRASATPSWRAPAVAVLTASFAASSLLAWPHYLAYFNATTPSGSAYTKFVDSSLDWGQDLDNLRAHLRARPAGSDRPVYLSYFGTADPLHHGLNEDGVRRLPGFFDWPSIRAQWADVNIATRLEPGTYAISATILQQVWSAPSREGSAAENAEFLALRAQFASSLGGGTEAARLAELRASLASDAAAARAWARFAELRLARLCRELRKREPDEQVGFSILIYEVDTAELARLSPGSL
jgi:hypothetical protein